MKRIVLAAAAALLASPALAQAPAQPPMRPGVPESPTGINGVLVSTAPDTVVLRQKDGSLLTVPMTRGWTVSRQRPDTPAGIKPGDFLASIQTAVDAGTGRATEVRVFEPGYRPEIGTHGMPMAGQSITHGTVESSTAAADGGQTLVVGFPDGKRTIQVPAATKVTRYDRVPTATAKPGVAVGGVTRRDPDGVRRAGRLVLADR